MEGCFDFCSVIKRAADCDLATIKQLVFRAAKNLDHLYSIYNRSTNTPFILLVQEDQKVCPHIVILSSLGASKVVFCIGYVAHFYGLHVILFIVEMSRACLLVSRDW